MAHWLVKSEPGSYGWDDLRRDGGTEWDGVRNNAAAAHLRAMQVGDRALFYHSGEAKAAVGIAAVTRAARRDGDEGNWVSVAIEPVDPLPRPVTLTEMKAAPALADMANAASVTAVGVAGQRHAMARDPGLGRKSGLTPSEGNRLRLPDTLHAETVEHRFVRNQRHPFHDGRRDQQPIEPRVLCCARSPPPRPRAPARSSGTDGFSPGGR